MEPIKAAAYQRFADLLRANNMKPVDVTNRSGVSSTVLSEWKAGKALPKADKLAAIARALSTTVEYLITGEDPQYIKLTSEELLLLNGFRAANDTRRADMLYMARSALLEKKDTLGTYTDLNKEA